MPRQIILSAFTVFHSFPFYFTALIPNKETTTFLWHPALAPYIRRFVRYFYHSNHRYFIAPRHIGDIIHLWTTFVVAIYDRSLPTSPSFKRFLACRSLRGDVSGRYPFHSTLWIIRSQPNILGYAAFSSNE